MLEKKLFVSKEGINKRLDKFLGEKLNFISRNKLQCLIESGDVLVNNKIKKSSYRLKENDIVLIRIEEEKEVLEPFKFEVKIIYEDKDIILVDKPESLIVHPPSINYNKTLINALIYMGKELSDISPLRKGVVHRLDKETSGVMVLAKNNKSHLNLVKQFKERKVKKEYLAIVWGILEKDKVRIELPIKRDPKNRLKMKVGFLHSKKALTELEVKERYKDSTLLVLYPFTGRMHQLRVHLKYLGFPIVGDKKYGIADNYSQLFLHSYKLGFFHPANGKFLEFISPVPKRFIEFIEKRKCIK